MRSDNDTPVFKTQQEHVYYQLREAILRGKFKPGKNITLRGISAMLGVSLMPVRDSLRRLTTERALQLLENRRITVPDMTPDKLTEIYQARIALECHAAVRAFSHIDNTDLIKLEELSAQGNMAINCSDIENHIYINFQFHRVLYSYGSPQVLMPLIESLWLQIAPFMQTIFAHIKESRVYSENNNPLQSTLNAIRMKDANLLKQSIQTNILADTIKLQQAMAWPLLE